MTRTMTGLLGAALWLGALIGDAQAKVVSYTVDGRRYAYDTRDPEQAEAAQRLIEAARAAQTAKAKADAERAATPLVAVFGSAAQRDAAAAGDRVRQMIPEGREAAPSPQEPGRRGRDARRARNRADADRRAATSPRAERPAGPSAQAGPGLTVIAKAERPEPAGAPPPSSPGDVDAAAGAAPEKTGKPALTSVTFDLSHGIKTVRLADGTVREEPLDSGTVAMLLAAEPAAAGLAAFAARVRAEHGEPAGSPADTGQRED